MNPHFVHLMATIRGAAAGTLIGIMFLMLTGLAGEIQLWWYLTIIPVALAGIFAGEALTEIMDKAAELAEPWDQSDLDTLHRWNSSTSPKASRSISVPADSYGSEVCTNCGGAVGALDRICGNCGAGFFDPTEGNCDD